MKWKEEQLQDGVTRQLKLMAAEKELKEAVAEKGEELKETRQHLERERVEGGKREREVVRLTGELEETCTTVKSLEKKVGCVCCMMRAWREEQVCERV